MTDFREYPQTLLDSDRRIGKIVFDLDDVAHGLNKSIAQYLGIDYDDIVDFRAIENTRLPLETRQAINECYKDIKFFKNIQFYPGFERIMELQEKYPIYNQVNSSSFSQEIRYSKYRALRATVPLLLPKQIRLSLVGVKSTVHKRFDDDTLILLDDSPYNVALSPAKLNILPMQPWNQTPKALDLMKSKPIRFVPRGDFDAIFQAIDEFFATFLPTT